MHEYIQKSEDIESNTNTKMQSKNLLIRWKNKPKTKNQSIKLHAVPNDRMNRKKNNKRQKAHDRHMHTHTEIEKKK